MSIYAIADLHLSFGENKPMDIFGKLWENHEKKVEENWLKTVEEEDLVILPGDFSWAMTLKDTFLDFYFLNNLPGKKILLKGNHDYWWSTLKKNKEFIESNNFKNIEFLYNNSFFYENTIITGTRGWSIQEDNAEKIIRRENIRLANSIVDGIRKYGEDKEIIICMHYPPFTGFETPELNFIKTMKKYNVKQCIYGHLHGTDAQKSAKQGMIDDIDFKLVSADYTKFNLVKIK